MRELIEKWIDEYHDNPHRKTKDGIPSCYAQNLAKFLCEKLYNRRVTLKQLIDDYNSMVNDKDWGVEHEVTVEDFSEWGVDTPPPKRYNRTEWAVFAVVWCAVYITWTLAAIGFAL